jgi:hypothetical protein
VLKLLLSSFPRRHWTRRAGYGKPSFSVYEQRPLEMSTVVVLLRQQRSLE